MRQIPVILLFLASGCNLTGDFGLFNDTVHLAEQDSLPMVSGSAPEFEEGSWPYFLRNLKIVDGPVVDFRGMAVADQYKQAGILPYDVGNRDLQQCADAIMRLRAEYLFEQKRTGEIGFHFTGGQWYSFHDYCAGKIPQPKGHDVVFVNRNRSEKNRQSLRKYLDLVYTYAGTISLARELKKADDFEVGTVVIYPGSPGHCFIIIDEMINEKGERLFKLAEGYTPAQSIYVLRNLSEPGKNPWHKLSKGTITTASYSFTEYRLGRFE